MILRLELPAPPDVVGDLHLGRWLVGVGEPLTYGDVVCTLRVASITLPARSVTGRSLLGRRRAHTAGRRRLPAAFDIRVVASDDAVLRSHDKVPGEAVRSGSVLGLATTEPDEPLEAAAVYAFRLILETDEQGGAL